MSRILALLTSVAFSMAVASVCVLGELAVGAVQAVELTLSQRDEPEQGDTLSDLPCFEVNRPCYLVDLTSATPSSTTTIGLGPVPNINGNAFTSSATYDHTLAVGQVHQFDLNGVDAHPFHLVRARPRDATNLCLTAPRL